MTSLLRRLTGGKIAVSLGWIERLEIRCQRQATDCRILQYFRLTALAGEHILKT